MRHLAALLGLTFAACAAAQPLSVETPPGTAAAASAPAQQAPPQAFLRQIMADPEWIGAPVEAPFWGLDGKHVVYRLEREGSSLRDSYVLDLSDGKSRVLGDAGKAGIDAADPVYDVRRERALFVRNGDVFLRDLASGALRQLTRTDAVESNPQFLHDSALHGNDVAWQVDNQWLVHDLDGGVGGPAAILKFDKDPDEAPEADTLRDAQLRLFSTLAREKADKDAARQQEQAERRADPGRAPLPFHLGEKRELAGSALSPDARWLLVVLQPKGAEAGRVGKMPKYVTESGYNEIEDVRTRVGRNAPIAQELLLLDLARHVQHPLPFDPLAGIAEDPLATLRAEQDLPALEGNRPLRINAIEWARDGSRAAVQLRAIDNKDRWIAALEPGTAQLRPLHRLTDAAWINWNFNEFGWLHDNETLWLLSEQDGFSHLYLVDAARRGATARQLTDGDWEVSAPQLSADGKRFVFVCNREWPGEYELCEKPVRGGSVRTLTDLDGVEFFAVSPKGERLLVGYSGTYLPMQLAVVPSAGGEARVLTDTRSAAFRAIDWQQPEIVQIPSSHGARPIWTKLYMPAGASANATSSTRHPLVVFVHGAGYTQNTHARYPYYFREQMFHNLLTQAGYIVLDMDYRASEGYGRDWRTAIYRQMGHPELEDLIDGVEWAVENRNADSERVGVYGGSYGGFMAFMAMFRAPEVFKAGAALRPVTDWPMYNHEYTSNILNTPGIDPEAYRKSSPIEYAGGLQGHLLIAHGMLDDNVFYQDSVRLAQRLIELEKEHWELAGYPLERHAFVHPESWLDEYRRIFRLFEATLKP